MSSMRAVATNMSRYLTNGHIHLPRRSLSVFNEFAKQLKGEAKSNPEFQQSIKELNEKFDVVTDGFKDSTKKTTEKLYKSADSIWTEAGATSKRVSASVKEKLSAATEEVKERFGVNQGEAFSTFSRDATKASSEHSSGNESSQQGDQSQNLGADMQSHAFGELFVKLKSSLASAAPAVSGAFEKIKETRVSNLAQKGYEIVKDELTSSGTKKKRMKPTVSGERSDRTDLVLTPTKKSRIRETWEACKQKVEEIPIVKRVISYTKPVAEKGREIAEEVQERWETSDNPVVNKIQDLNETVFGETATALSYKEIRYRDPNFDLAEFVSEVQEMVRPVLVAYMKGDAETLKTYCTNEAIERCKAERKAYEANGIFYDNKILHISEVEVRETKMIGSTPFIILAFQTQQIYCVRDREGSITLGGKDTIQNVVYAWAMRLMDPDELGEGSYFPEWRLHEMQQLGYQALI